MSEDHVSTIAELYEEEQKKERERIVKRLIQNYNATEKEYDAIAPLYQQSFQHHARDIGPFITFANLHPGQKVLELGCGAGWVTTQAACRVGPEGRVVAIDASGRCLRQASITATLWGLQNIQVLKGDMHDLKKFPGLQGSDLTFDRIILLWVMQLVAPDKQKQFLDHLARYLSPGGMIVFSIDHEYHELACVEALPFDGTNPDELHLLIGDERSFEETRKLARNVVEGAGLEVVAVEGCYRDNCCRYEDCTTEIREKANAAWQKDGGATKECSRLYLEFFKCVEVTKIMEIRMKQAQNVAVKNVSVLVAARGHHASASTIDLVPLLPRCEDASAVVDEEYIPDTDEIHIVYEQQRGFQPQGSNPRKV
ncbi:hypothetical protein ACJ73_07248 [Blastomyces percursus]|uniref:Methyltransferase domain-containing protein n=1 Tax=Blastomyces percursus TaxID=1658174 RepID=A0A1J9R046_9EURO|nr:hypothetical protein ACJ73_07248 [Blastomyces percursus]